ncbi:MAG TPA: outer membrane beta-barrel protein [Chitinophagaceae bacterium]|mgnify:CR=1 FL=1|nr:outer membrane beta-barrel protein [Chitinophagaceae bacterium]MCB9054741.1 outer membrane beta-barrel protein [Chitinophagales bacterium]HPG10395.1 outer membrane beta-barrel protein [Chitinophagaceae bacterium]HRX94865.1 outer membrane beta-barrel protein [Chitinophagaceae bacterium]
MQRKRVFLLVLLAASTLTNKVIYAQYYFYNDRYYENAVVVDFGGSIGLMNAFTDLGGKKGIGKNFIKDLNWKNTKTCFGVYATAMYQGKIGLRLQATFGEVAAYDSILKDVKESTFGRYERNLSFKSKITDIQLGIEIHPLYFKYYADEPPPPFSPYIFAGVGIFTFDPQANLNGQWHSLQPLKTEGQGFAEYPEREPYSLTQLNYSAGLGVKYEINSFVNARLEINHRFLQTDYLDDVSKDYIDKSLFANYLPSNLAAIASQLYSRKEELNPADITIPGQQRGDPKDNDAFFTIELKVGVTLGRVKR